MLELDFVIVCVANNLCIDILLKLVELFLILVNLLLVLLKLAFYKLLFLQELRDFICFY